MRSYGIFIVYLMIMGLISARVNAQLDDIPFEDIPRPGGVDEIRRIVDQAIRENHERMERLRAERKGWFDRQAMDGHTIEVVPDGPTLLQKRLESIRSAEKSIYLSTFIFDSDETGLKIAKALCFKARQGVDVRLLVDSFGSKKFYNGYADRMRNCGAGILLFNPPSWGLNAIAYVIHEKILVIDGETVHLGGNGMQNSYHHIQPAHKFFHDIDIKVKGPIACWFHKKFVETYRESRMWDAPPDVLGSGGRSERYEDYLFGSRTYEECSEKMFGDAKMVPVYSNPLFSKKRPIFETYVDAFLASEGEIKLYSPYFVPHDGFLAALLWARKNNIKVTVMTNSIESNDEGTGVLVAMVYRIGKLVKAGVDIRLWKGPYTLHRKSGIYDGKWAYVGSDNLDSRGHKYSSESIAFSNDKVFVERINQEFETDLQNTTPLTRDYMRKILETQSSFKRWMIEKILVDYF
ncbi:MAG: phosphatidylserine/phosphatidylglycerophosphate/cardiolipin synthase family protein [Bdellovibrio sp.]|nr:phosphatidylserine/phosphatidylglycerophosphate/cardiolipin synthase family protein [Bdellovibrio sp.]